MQWDIYVAHTQPPPIHPTVGCVARAQIRVPGNVDVARAKLLLHAVSTDAAVRHPFDGAHLYLHQDCNGRVGQTTAGRGGKFARSPNGEVQTKGQVNA